MKKALDLAWTFIKLVFMLLYALVWSILMWWPVLAIGLVAVFLVAFISEIAAIVLASLVAFLFLLVFIIKLT